MSSKNQFPSTFNWQSTNPVTGFLPSPYQTGSKPSGTVFGVCASTNTIYSNILDMSHMDNEGVEIAFTGTPTGTLTVYGSNSGINFFALTFTPAFTQPSGAALVLGLDLNQFPWKYMTFQYVNVSGSGTLAIYLQSKSLS